MINSLIQQFVGAWAIVETYLFVTNRKKKQKGSLRPPKGLKASNKKRNKQVQSKKIHFALNIETSPWRIHFTFDVK
jgi:hypothetical protein